MPTAEPPGGSHPMIIQKLNNQMDGSNQIMALLCFMLRSQITGKGTKELLEEIKIHIAFHLAE